MPRRKSATGASPTTKAPFRITPVVLHVLLSLADGEAHGYAIMQAIADRSEGSVNVAPGSLYFTLSRLLDAGMIRAAEGIADPDSEGPPRKVYAMTSFGREVLRGEVTRMADIVAFAKEKDLLTGPHRG